MGLFDDIIDTAVSVASGGGAGIIGEVLNVVFPQVEEIVASFTQFESQLTDIVTNPVQGFIEEIEDGSVWEGDGAEAFKEECRSIFLTQNQEIQSGLGAFGSMLGQAQSIMKETDKKALSQVNLFAEAVSNIKIR